MRWVLAKMPFIPRRSHEREMKALREDIAILSARLRQCDPSYERIESGILVGGSGSSGTTLLRKLLNRHPDVYCGPEWCVFYNPAIYTGFSELSVEDRKLLVTSGFSRFPHLQPPSLLWGRAPDRPMVVTKFVNPGNRATAGLTTHWLQSLAVGAVDFWDFATLLFGHLAGRQGKRYWAEKTPINCRAYQPFLDAHPRNRCIHLVRDGRDVALSLMKRGFAMSSAVERWVRDSASYLPLKDDPRLLVVRFEDLVQDPAKELTNIFGFAEVPIEDASCILSGSNNAAREMNRKGASATWGASPDAGVDSSIAGKWRLQERSVLVALESEFANVVECGRANLTGYDLLTRFGY